jgi:hypothetical protein
MEQLVELGGNGRAHRGQSAGVGVGVSKDGRGLLLA